MRGEADDDPRDDPPDDERDIEPDDGSPLWDLIRAGDPRPGRLRRWVLRPLLWLLTGLAVLLFVLQIWLDSPHAKRWAAEILAEKLGARLDRPVTVRDVAFELLPFSVEIWGLVIGSPEGIETPFLEVPWASLDLDLQALRGGDVRLRQVRVERPRIALQFLADGRDNLLTLRSKNPRPRRFDVYIDRLVVDRADFFLDRESLELSIDADAIRARLRGVGELQLSGQLVAQNVLLRLPDAEPLRAAVAMQGEFRRGRVDILSARISGPGLSGSAKGFCAWGRDDPAGRRCEIDTEAETDGTLLAALGYFHELSGPLEIAGRVGWRPGSFGWRGEVRSPRLVLWGRRLDEVDGMIVADRHRIRLGLTQASYADGHLAGTIEYQHGIREERRMVVDLDFQNVLLETLLADQNIPLGESASRLDGRLRYAFPFHDSSHGDGFGEVALRSDPRRAGIPLSGAFPLTIENGVVGSESIQLISSRQSALARGTYEIESRRGRFAYEVASADVRELLELLPMARDADDANWPRWLPTAGQGELSGNLELDGDRLATDVRWRLEQVYGRDIGGPKRLNGALRYTPERIDPLRVEIADQDGALSMSGRVPLVDGEGSILVLGFDAVDWPLAAARPWLTFDLPIDGRISGRFDLRIDPAGSEGDLRGYITPASLWGVPVDRLAGHLGWDADNLRLDDLRITAPSGSAYGHGTLGWENRELDLRVRGRNLDLGASPLAAYLPHPDLGGRASIEARFTGPIDHPNLDLELDADPLTLRGKRLGDRPSHLAVRWMDGELDVRGRLLDRIGLRGGGTYDMERADLVFALQSADVGGLLEVLLAEPPQGVDGNFQGHLRIAGTAATPRVELELDDFEMLYRGHALHAVEPVRLALHQEHVEIASFYLEEAPGDGAEMSTESTGLAPDPGSTLFLTGDVGWRATDPIDLRLESRLSTRWVELLLPNLRVAGEIDLLGRVGGSLVDPLFDGLGALRGGSVRLLGEGGELPYALENAVGLVLFEPRVVLLDHLEGELAGGTVALAGRIRLPAPDSAGGESPGDERPLDYRLQLDARDLRMRYPEGFRIAGDANLTLRSLNATDSESGEGAGSLLSGRARLDELQYLADIPVGFAQMMRRFLRRQRLEMSQADPILSTYALNLEIDAPGGLRIRNNLAELTGSADLVVRGTFAQPVLFGTLDLDPGGVLDYAGTEYTLERGRLRFNDPSAINPQVDLAASTRVRDFQISLNLAGTMDDLEARFSSNPPLPDVDVFRILASGGELDPDLSPRRPLEELEREEQNAAATFLYGQAASVIGNRMSNLFRFDTFRIDPLTGSGDNISSARLTLGKRLSKDFFLSYSTDPSSTEDQRFQIEWRISSSLTLVLTQNGDNSYEADARWETSF